MKIGCVIVDLTKSMYKNPVHLIKDEIDNDTLFWFIIKSGEIFQKEEAIFNDIKFAFRIARLYPYNLWKEKGENDDVYFIYGAYLWNNYFLDKDPIREKHIWKDIEWGKRSKNYNDMWKDPWTVRLKLIDDWKWKVINHVYYQPEEIFERIKKCSCKNWNIAYLFTNNYKSVDGFEVCNI